MTATVAVDVRNRRNSYGVKDQCDCYRTVNGEHFIAWLSYPSADRVMAYRSAGIKCRRFGEELYLRLADKNAALALDESLDGCGGAQ